MRNVREHGVARCRHTGDGGEWWCERVTVLVVVVVSGGVVLLHSPLPSPLSPPPITCHTCHMSSSSTIPHPPTSHHASAPFLLLSTRCDAVVDVAVPCRCLAVVCCVCACLARPAWWWCGWALRSCTRRTCSSQAATPHGSTTTSSTSSTMHSHMGTSSHLHAAHTRQPCASSHPRAPSSSCTRQVYAQHAHSHSTPAVPVDDPQPLASRRRQARATELAAARGVRARSPVSPGACADASASRPAHERAEGESEGKKPLPLTLAASACSPSDRTLICRCPLRCPLPASARVRRGGAAGQCGGLRLPGGCGAAVLLPPQRPLACSAQYGRLPLVPPHIQPQPRALRPLRLHPTLGQQRHGHNTPPHAHHTTTPALLMRCCCCCRVVRPGPRAACCTPCVPAVPLLPPRLPMCPCCASPPRAPGQLARLRRVRAAVHTAADAEVGQQLGSGSWRGQR